MSALSKYLLVQGWFGGMKQSSVNCCFSVSVLISDKWMTSGLTKNTQYHPWRVHLEPSQASGMDLLVKTVNLFRLMANFWMCLHLLWRSFLNHFIFISFRQLPHKVSDGIINSNCYQWLVSFPSIFITDFQQSVVCLGNRNY